MKTKIRMNTNPRGPGRLPTVNFLVALLGKRKVQLIEAAAEIADMPLVDWLRVNIMDATRRDLKPLPFPDDMIK